MRTVTVSTIVLILLGLTGSAQAIPCVGVADELPGLTGVTCSMIDNQQQLTVTLLGTAVTETTTKVVPNVFSFFGTNWKVRLTIGLTDNPAGDQVFLLGRVFHQAQPHPVWAGVPDDIKDVPIVTKPFAQGDLVSMLLKAIGPARQGGSS